ncbi:MULTISPECIES: FtsW/RodA/SpoVE family cell cycle protein [unclassified Sphingomonas]|uniref:FtsW/RodA/SpoVE family cell cycle protein n=1 Tax=Sphingomonas TaxID=13687 RepID=UPI001AD0AF93|nr:MULTISPECIES: FtsW/RodA/SpoVE family cell cycle protein [unclassified Sphingomonas]MBN8810843.1 FtsW/RodA/SpoVE family cell cycle protein [Sphingomonas sp.]
MIRLLAMALVDLAAALLPARLGHWGEAMRRETGEIAASAEALRFAFGCLRGAIGEAMRVHGGDGAMWRGRGRVGFCAIGATGLGIAYMAIGGAPFGYPLRNLAALLIGFLAVGIVMHLPRTRLLAAGPVLLALGLFLLAASLLGVSNEGATRWISIYGLSIQPSLVLVPVLAIGFAAVRDRLSTLGVIAAAGALALQPDRAMAGALAAGLAALALVRPERKVWLALLAASAGSVATLLQPDVQPAMPFVDQILFTAFAVHPLAGLMVVAGSLLSLVPARARWRRDPGYAVFGALWLAIVLAAALGNYPTPLVGYGGSAIVGYLLSMLGLPKAIGATDGVADLPRREAEHGVLRTSIA